MGHEVTIVCGSYEVANTGLTQDFINGMRRGYVDGIDVIELKQSYSNKQNFLKRAWTFVKFSMRTIKITLKEDYDFIYATSTPLTITIPAIASKVFRKKPFIFEVRDLWPELPKAMGVIKNPVVLLLLDILESVSYSMAKGLVGLSPGICDGIKKKTKPTKPLLMAPNGCDLDLFHPAIVSASTKKTNVKAIRGASFRAIFSGAHGMANGLESVLDVASELQKRGRKDIEILLVGDGMMKQSLMDRAEKENLNNVVFQDVVPKVELVKLFSSSNVGLQLLANIPAFYWGTSPNKFFDYIAAGLPVITNYPGWIAELVTENKCGFAVEPDNAKKFADALENMADNPKICGEMSKVSRRLAETKFDRDDQAKDIEKFILNIVG